MRRYLKNCKTNDKTVESLANIRNVLPRSKPSMTKVTLLNLNMSTIGDIIVTIRKKCR